MSAIEEGRPSLAPRSGALAFEKLTKNSTESAYEKIDNFSARPGSGLRRSSSFAQSSATSESDDKSSSVQAQDMKDIKEVRASKLVGINVTSKDGENLGQVQDLVINPMTGKIRYALIGQGFMAGLGQKMIPVPWQAVNVRSEREFALHVDKQKLTSAPDWSQREMDQPAYIIRVDRFYELEPQGEVGGLGASSSESGQGTGSSLDSKSNSPVEILRINPLRSNNLNPIRVSPIRLRNNPAMGMAELTFGIGTQLSAPSRCPLGLGAFRSQRCEDWSNR